MSCLRLAQITESHRLSDDFQNIGVTRIALSWFDYYGGDVKAVAGGRKVQDDRRCGSNRQRKRQNADARQRNNRVTHTIEIGSHGVRRVREGAFAACMDH